MDQFLHQRGATALSIPVSAFLQKVQEIVSSNPSYRNGGTGKDGTCDCIGLIIGAIRRAGGKWTGLHGSNYAARHELSSLSPISSAAALQPGEVVFKAYSPGESQYSLPSRYQPGGTYSNGDLLDYYHVGVVAGVQPLKIIHMTTPNAQTDTKPGKWKYHGWLKSLDSSSFASTLQSIKAGNSSSASIHQSAKASGSSSVAIQQTAHQNSSEPIQKGETPMQKIRIYGGELSAPIHMRSFASTSAKIIADIPQNSEAELVADRGDWCCITWAGCSGYVKSQFVHEEGARRTEEAPAANPDEITVSRKALASLYDSLGDLLGLRG